MPSLGYFLALLVPISLFMSGCTKTHEPVAHKSSHEATTGVFKLKFAEPKTDDEKDAMNLVKTELEKVVKDLNSRLGLPHDISIIFSSDPRGPLYSPSVMTGLLVEGERGRLIAFPYGFITIVRDTLKGGGLKDKELDDATIGTTSMLLVHEASHALIDVLDLPVLGREEDAADSGSAIFLTGLENGAKTVNYAVHFWKYFGERRGVHLMSFSDEHGVDIQRAYNLLCWTYGKNINRNAFLASELPPDRARRCSGEYRKLADSWDEVLHDHLKKDF